MPMTIERTPATAFVDTQPFVMERRIVRFADDTRFEILAQVEEGEGRYSVERNGQHGIWEPLPGTINTACAPGEYQLLVTSTVPAGAPTAVLTVETSGEEVEDDSECETCLPGKWILDNSSYFAHMGGLWPLVMAGVAGFGLDTEGVESYPTDVFGLMRLTFREDGIATGIQEGWGIAGEAVKDDKTVTGRMTYNGEGAAAWRVMVNPEDEQRYVFFDGGEFSLSGRMTLMGFEQRPIPFPESNDPVFLSSPQPFLCTDTTLTYYADDPVGPVVFFRDVEDLP
jgi:hypothetical protein